MRHSTFSLALVACVILVGYVGFKYSSRPLDIPEGVNGFDLAALTIVGESEFETVEGMYGVACVIVARLKRNPYGWKDLKEVVTAHGWSGRYRRYVWQFEPWSRRPYKLLAMLNACKLDIKSGACRRVTQARTLLSIALNHRMPCPLEAVCPPGGAWYFANTRTVKKRYGRKPTFASSRKKVIGRHTFYCR